MGVRYQRRMNFGSGLGLNFSKSGVSPSYRTKSGSIGAKGFSVRSGIPGLSYRSSWGKGSGGAAIGLLVVATFAAINIAFALAVVAVKILVALAALVFNALWFLTAVVVNGITWLFGAIGGSARSRGHAVKSPVAHADGAVCPSDRIRDPVSAPTQAE